MAVDAGRCVWQRQLVKRRVFLAAIAAAALAAATELQLPARAAGTRVVAIGDVHGNAEAFDAILRQTGLMDASGAWTGGRAILVQTGDITDRGSGVRAVMDRLMSLEKQATVHGGRVHVLLGNHEVMNMLGDLRDVSPGAYAAFADARSQTTRGRAHSAYKRFLAERRDDVGHDGLPSADEWLAAHPPGYVEYREAFAPNGRYGRWLRAKDAVVQIGDIIFLHAGVNPEVLPRRLDDINSQVRRDIRMWDSGLRSLTERRRALPFFTIEPSVRAAARELQLLAQLLDPDVVARQGLPAGVNESLIPNLQAMVSVSSSSLLNPEGPLWFRGLATWTDEEGTPQISKLLRTYGASHIVIGHTPTASRAITPRFGGRVFLIDTGMLGGRFYPGGRAAALEIENSRFVAVDLDGRTVLIEPQ